MPTVGHGKRTRAEVPIFSEAASARRPKYRKTEHFTSVSKSPDTNETVLSDPDSLLVASSAAAPPPMVHMSEPLAHNTTFLTELLSYVYNEVSRKYRYVAQKELAWFRLNGLTGVRKRTRLDAVMQSLHANGTLDEGGRLASFTSTTTATQERTRTSLFKEAVYAIIHADPSFPKSKSQQAKINLPLLNVFVREKTLKGNSPNSCRPDIIFYLGDAECPSLDWLAVVGNGEWKNTVAIGKLRDNRAKFIWGAFNLLCDDPRRNFVMGITVENDLAQLWRVSHAGIIVSQPFKWIEDPVNLVHYVLCFCHYPTNDSEREEALRKMGMDPTLTLIPRHPADNESAATRTDGTDDSRTPRDWAGDYKTDDKGYPMFEFQMDALAPDNLDGEKTRCTFHTISMRWNFKSGKLVSRATRVYEAIQVNPDTKERIGGHTYMMRECWITAGDQSEGTIYEDMKRRVMEKTLADPSSTLKTRFDESFLPILGDDLLDASLDTESGGPSPLYPHEIRGIVNGDVREILKERTSQGHDATHDVLDTISSRTNLDNPKKLTLSAPRYKNRTLYARANEIKSLNSLTNPKHILKALIGACDALQVLYELGMVHRDVSSGNVYYDDGPTKTGRLGDLEFVREYTAVAKGHPRTGTDLFMSAEVALGTFANSQVEDGDDSVPESFLQKWCHSPAHDGESLYWLLKYVGCAFDTIWLGWELAHHPGVDISPQFRADHLYPLVMLKDPLDRNRILLHSVDLPMDLMLYGNQKRGFRRYIRNTWTGQVLTAAETIGKLVKTTFATAFKGKPCENGFGYALEEYDNLFPSIKQVLVDLEPVFCCPGRLERQCQVEVKPRLLNLPS